VLVIGAGGLGSPALLYLAAAGVGRLGVIDPDRVELSNLQRQVLYDTASCGIAKVEQARDRLCALNPHLRIDVYPEPFDLANAASLVAAYDVIVEGSDQFATKYLVNDACVLARKPYIGASIRAFSGMLSVYAAPDGPCYRCLFPEMPDPATIPSCAQAGVLGTVPGLFGTNGSWPIRDVASSRSAQADFGNRRAADRRLADGRFAGDALSKIAVTARVELPGLRRCAHDPRARRNPLRLRQCCLRQCC